MPTTLEITKAAFVIGATAAILAIGWKQRWFIHKAGIMGLFASFVIMATAAFPPPLPRAWQIAVILIVLTVCAIFAFWSPTGTSRLAEQIEQMVQEKTAKTTRKETDDEEVKYVPVPDAPTPGDTITGWVPQ